MPVDVRLAKTNGARCLEHKLFTRRGPPCATIRTGVLQQGWGGRIVLYIDSVPYGVWTVFNLETFLQELS